MFLDRVHGRIRDHTIRVAERAFDDFAGAGVDASANKRMFGIA